MLTGRGDRRIRSCPFKNNRTSNFVGYPMDISAGFVHCQVLEICECKERKNRSLAATHKKCLFELLTTFLPTNDCEVSQPARAEGVS